VEKFCQGEKEQHCGAEIAENMRADRDDKNHAAAGEKKRSVSFNLRVLADKWVDWVVGSDD